MRLKFSEIGTSLGTRTLGRKIRLQIENSINANKRVVFDFKNVELVSHAFADECFGKLIENADIQKVKSLTTFKNTNEPVKRVITFSINERVNSLNTKA